MGPRFFCSLSFQGSAPVPVIVERRKAERPVKRKRRLIVGGDLEIGDLRALPRRLREQRTHDRPPQALPPMRWRGVHREQTDARAFQLGQPTGNDLALAI